jgi:hypothetical protein
VFRFSVIAPSLNLVMLCRAEGTVEPVLYPCFAAHKKDRGKHLQVLVEEIEKKLISTLVLGFDAIVGKITPKRKSELEDVETGM